MRGARVAFDLTVNSFDNRVPEALDSLTPDVWVCVFKDSTSPLPILIGLSHDVLDRGIGHVGSIAIPDFVWDILAPRGGGGGRARSLYATPPPQPPPQDGVLILAHFARAACWLACLLACCLLAC